MSSTRGSACCRLEFYPPHAFVFRAICFSNNLSFQQSSLTIFHGAIKATSINSTGILSPTHRHPQPPTLNASMALLASNFFLSLSLSLRRAAHHDSTSFGIDFL
mmetsp:Transcript_25815/g.37889  ORF Transcript_25815/g.37889 Transcript_25815/m.37889 type:complete len:104 (-) Transcript_25815:135-446(-)